MRVLVTRPQPAAARTARRLQALGHEAIILPLMQAVHAPETARAALKENHAAIALTSAEAARALATIADALLPHLDTPVFCVGAATASAAAGLGFRNVVTGPGAGEGLAGVISTALSGTCRNILYLAGTPRAPGFEIGLDKAGIRLLAVECYHMVPIEHAPHAVERAVRQADVVLLYSRQTALRFLALSGAGDAADLRYLCLSRTIAEALPPAIKNVAVAETPDEQRLFGLL